MDIMKFVGSMCLFFGFCGAIADAATSDSLGAYLCAGLLGIAMAINHKHIDD